MPRREDARHPHWAKQWVEPIESGRIQPDLAAWRFSTLKNWYPVGAERAASRDPGLGAENDRTGPDSDRPPRPVIARTRPLDSWLPTKSLPCLIGVGIEGVGPKP